MSSVLLSLLSHSGHPVTQKKFTIFGDPDRQEADMTAMHINKI